MTIYLFYHPDTDGITAAAIIRYAARNRWPDARFEYIRHGYLTEDKRLQTLAPDGDTKIFAVDISFHPETTRRLQRLFGENFIWIDHHASAIDRWAATGYEEPAGVRDTSRSAAWLTWHHLFDRPAPLAVELADKYDLWQQDDTWDMQTYPWQLVVMNQFGDPGHYDLRVLDDDVLLHGYVRRYGEPMLTYERQLRRREEHTVQPIILRTKDKAYKMLFINSSLRDSLTLSAWHRRHPEVKADGYLVGQLASPQQWKMSLYMAVGSDLDAAQVAAAFGGGGHRSAAGFSLSATDFTTHISFNHMKLFRKIFVAVSNWKGFPKNDRIRRALGDYHFDKDEFNKALYWYTYARSVRIDDPIRQERLGFLYGILGDEERMAYHLTNAVRFGNQNALEHFATCFIKQKPEIVAELAREAVHAGDKHAESLLIGSLEAMNRYDDELLGLLRKHAEEGDGQAQFDLGCCYLEGKGVSQDDAQAFLWTLLAAIQRHPTAQNNIGYMYERGICVRQDRQQAFSWFLRAASDRCPLGRENLLEYLSDTGSE